eukprot:TRINITY_DN1528_c0_g1_i1.p2 TRINITY_DN1528_c0_g1~~TRINITY_DN1528_c0_g1_i1.p2  ORF type:complete len:200 (+),score=37.29 TRINITY_DN1528_c0_g1_i1:1264-1863(+)
MDLQTAIKAIKLALVEMECADVLQYLQTVAAENVAPRAVQLIEKFIQRRCIELSDEKFVAVYGDIELHLPQQQQQAKRLTPQTPSRSEMISSVPASSVSFVPVSAGLSSFRASGPQLAAAMPSLDQESVRASDIVTLQWMSPPKTDQISFTPHTSPISPSLKRRSHALRRNNEWRRALSPLKLHYGTESDQENVGPTDQ